jgi:16S rRNA (adenine1518-N6/adenine1519-N6)-dimethyltransferase
MKLSEMRRILEERNLRLTKSLGQNFLHDSNQLNRIVALAELSEADKVLEIGPGLGPLTELLIARAGEVLAIEQDARLVSWLAERFDSDHSAVRDADQVRKSAAPSRMRQRAACLQLVHADALEVIRRDDRDWSDWKLVANLPYSVASPILVELATAPRGPRCMVVTLQLEVARRLMATPSSQDYGLLTVLVQLGYQPDDWFRIPASCFFPEPDVQSACVRLSRRSQALLDPALKPAFARIVKRAFSQRRKMMLKLLKADWSAEALERAFEATGIPKNARAETLAPGQFARLTSLMAGQV